jgi:hypothetical protein
MEFVAYCLLATIYLLVGQLVDSVANATPARSSAVPAATASQSTAKAVAPSAPRLELSNPVEESYDRAA